MEKVIEFNIEEEEFKKYLEECLTQENISYEIKIEDRWIQKFKNPSKYYQVFCLYVNNNDFDNVKHFIKDYENGTIITDNIEELKNIEDEENNNDSKLFTKKSFLKYYWGAIIVIGILLIIGIKFLS